MSERRVTTATSPPLVMTRTSTSDPLPTPMTAKRLMEDIKNGFQSLQKLVEHFLRYEKSLSQDKSLGKEGEVFSYSRTFKPSPLPRQIPWRGRNFLLSCQPSKENLHQHHNFHFAAMRDPMDLNLNPNDHNVDKYLLEQMEQRIRSLQTEYDNILQLEESFSQGKSLSKAEQEVLSNKHNISNCITVFKMFVMLSKPSHQGQLSFDPNLVDGNTIASTCLYQGKLIINEKTSKDVIYPPVKVVELGDKERYICVSDGFTICRLDLKQCKEEPSDYWSSVQKVPLKISTLWLLEEGHPFSLGLFKLGNDAYMAGGQEFPGFRNRDLLDLKVLHSELEVFSFLYEKYGVKGEYSSCKIYLLSVVADGSLALSKCDKFRPSKKPKVWPVFERIDDHIHMIETFPSLERAEIPCHEVLDLKGDWTELPPVYLPGSEEHGVCIWNRLVIGNKMYARDRWIYDILVFDSERNIWKRQKVRGSPPSVMHIKHVSEILRFGFGSCIGEFSHGNSADHPLYVVLALGPDEQSDMTRAVAYLVTEEGQILCLQRLNRFLEGFNESLSSPMEGTVIRGGDKGKTMYAILRGCGTDTLFITAFTWEVADDARELISGLLAHESACVVEEDFVHVVVRDWYVSQLGTGLESHNLPTRLTACFLHFVLNRLTACFL